MEGQYFRFRHVFVLANITVWYSFNREHEIVLFNTGSRYKASIHFAGFTVFYYLYNTALLNNFSSLKVEKLCCELK